ncbi:hypothetical protein [Streptomyces clavuligerus]|uniref:hypothetical protein n=1 Tax=Streptomyces clavuligerus TaxID=1901 RepID=UPI002F2B205B
MGRSLLAGSVVFAEWIAACERALVPFTGWSLTAVLRGVRVLRRWSVSMWCSGPVRGDGVLG